MAIILEGILENMEFHSSRQSIESATGLKGLRLWIYKLIRNHLESPTWNAPERALIGSWFVFFLKLLLVNHQQAILKEMYEQWSVHPGWLLLCREWTTNRLYISIMISQYEDPVIKQVCRMECHWCCSHALGILVLGDSQWAAHLPPKLRGFVGKLIYTFSIWV